MARKFVTERDHAFIGRINKELIQRVIGQEVIYYPISRDDTVPHSLYGESIDKNWEAPVVLNCLVNYDSPLVKSTDIGLDTEYTLDVYALTQELEERNLVPREGDFVEFGQVFFEVTSVTKPQLVFGQVNNKIMTRLSCVAAREGTFAAGGYSTHELEDNTHPVQTPPTRDLGDD